MRLQPTSATACSIPTQVPKRLVAYDDPNHPVVCLRRFIGGGYEWQALAGPAYVQPVRRHLVVIDESLEDRIGAPLGQALIKTR